MPISGQMRRRFTIADSPSARGTPRVKHVFSIDVRLDRIDLTSLLSQKNLSLRVGPTMAFNSQLLYSFLV
jgi:hypothetical protein